jgi:hypothetical protein
MRQELVFIGQGLNSLQVRDSLDQCLLTEEELLAGKKYWRTLTDPSQKVFITQKEKAAQEQHSSLQ